jgi:FKBP-type peptidyl-prolyl cis-trans isomerase
MSGSLARRALPALLVPALLLGCGEKAHVEVSEAGAHGSTGGGEGGAGPEGSPEVLERAGGVRVEVIEQGDGAPVHTGNVVLMHYRGYVVAAEEGEEDREFVSTYALNHPQPRELGTDDLVVGLTRGLDGLAVGTIAEVHVPAELGYGEAGLAPDVPADADLRFYVHILEAK